MRIGFDHIFQVWRVLFHDQLISIDGVFSWDSKKQLHRDLARKGLALKGNKVVVIRETISG
jgi:hypothetical protein